MEENKRIVAFPVRKHKLQEALKGFRLRCGDNTWRSNPVQVFPEENNFTVIVEVFGSYPFMDNQLEDIGKKYDPNT